jgi:hypothetical protein
MNGTIFYHNETFDFGNKKKKNKDGKKKEKKLINSRE